MKKIKILASFALVGLTAFGLASCGNANSQASSSIKTNDPRESGSTEPSLQSSSSSASLSNTSSINYTLKVIDIDGEELLNRNITTTDKNSLFSYIDDNLTVTYTTGDTGHYITSLEESVVDPSYFLALYENGQMSSVGVDGIVLDDGDEIVFKNECWNTVETGYGTKTATDIKVDQIIYSTYKKMKEIYKDSTYIPYDLLFGYSALDYLEYYIHSDYIFPDAIKATYNNVSYDNLTISDTFKTAVALYALDKDLTEIKSYIQQSNFDLTAPFVETSAVYLADIMHTFEVEASNMSAYTNLINNLTLDINETSCMYISAMSSIDNYDFTTFVNGIKSALTENGFSYTMDWGYGPYTTCNASSTAQAILALTELGKNLNSNEFKVGNETLIDILLKYYNEETGLFYDSANDTNNLAYAEPQAIAALISYKILSEKGSVNIYRG